MTIEEINTGEEITEEIIEDETQEAETLVDVADDDSEDEAPEVELTTWTDDDGNEWEIPAAISPALMKNKDYTTKTQEVAAARKALEEQQEQWKQQQQRDEEDIKLDSELFSVESELKKYENVDWDRLEETNGPDDAQRHFRKMQLLQQQKANLSQTKQGRVQEKSQAAQHDVAKRFEEAKEWAVKNIPNYGPELLTKLDDYTESVGIDQNALRSNMSPAYMRMIYDGFVGHQIRSKAANKTPQKSNVTPLKQIKAKPTGTNRIDLTTASMSDYYKARKKGVGG